MLPIQQAARIAPDPQYSRIHHAHRLNHLFLATHPICFTLKISYT